LVALRPQGLYVLGCAVIVVAGVDVDQIGPGDHGRDIDFLGVDADQLQDGEAWDREEDFAMAGNNYKVDAVAGTVELNPTGALDKGAEIVISFAQGLPLENPCVVKTTPDGNLLISDYLNGLDGQNKKPTPRNGLLYKVDPTGKPVATFGKDGVLPMDCKDMAIDADGNLYIISLYHAAIALDSQGKQRYTFAGFTGSAGLGKDNPVFGGYWPMSIAMNEAHRAVIVNIDASNVLYDATKPDLTGYITVQHGKQGMELPPVYWQYIGPCIAAQGDYYYMTTSYHRLIKYKCDSTTKEFSIIWSTPQADAASDIKLAGPDQLWMAMGVELDGTGLIYVADRQNHRIQIFYDAGTTYKHVGSIGSLGNDAGKCQLMAPHALTLSPDRKYLYIADDGIFVKHVTVPIVKGLSRVVKWKLGAEEVIEAKLTVK